MTDIRDWEPVAGDNDDAAPNGFPEGIQAGDMNDSSREVMASVRRQWEQKDWFDFGDVVTRITDTQFTVPGDRTTDFVVDRRLRLVNAGDTKTISGDITVVAFSTVTTVDFAPTEGPTFDADTWLVSLGSEVTNPPIAPESVSGLLAAFTTQVEVITGNVILHADSVVTTGYLQCNGQAVSRTTFSDLFALIGTTFGVGDGSTTFNVPLIANVVADVIYIIKT